MLAETKGTLGTASNNVAEYNGAIAGLEEASKLGASEVELRTDSKLVVQQMTGRWKVHQPHLQVLHSLALKAVSLCKQVHSNGSLEGRMPMLIALPMRR